MLITRYPHRLSQSSQSKLYSTPILVYPRVGSPFIEELEEKIELLCETERATGGITVSKVFSQISLGEAVPSSGQPKENIREREKY